MGIFGEKIEEYEVLEHLGKGGFAHVYRARCLKSGAMVAIKMIDKELMARAGMVSRVRQEVTIHSRLKHPAILELYTFFEDADYVYLVLELAHNGELAKHFRLGTRGLSEQAAADIFNQVVKGVCYLHSHNILHRDLSLNNLLLTKDMRVKIADFGLATQLNAPDEKHVTMCGTPNYISPEVASRDYHGLPADVWGLGCMLYTLLVGQPPFHTQHVKSTLTKVINADYKIPEELSDAAKDMLQRLLCRDPSRRISLKSILEHPFLSCYTVSATNKMECSKDSGFNTTLQSNQNSRKKPESLHEMQRHKSMEIINTNDRPASFNVLSGLREGCNTPKTQNTERYPDKNQFEFDSLFNNNPISKQICTSNSLEMAKLNDVVNLMNIGCKENKENSVGSSNIHIGVPPLCSIRLPKVSHRTRNAILTISDCVVTVEFIKKRGKDREERITDICKISNDGMKVTICSINGGRGVLVSEKNIAENCYGSEEIFSYHNLPQKHWKKYLYAARFVDLVKAKTPKITIYSPKAKCQLMENGVDFEAFFYTGEKVALSSNDRLKIIDSNGILQQNNLQAIQLHFNEMLNKCRKIESALSCLGEECFPVTIGKRPISDKHNTPTTPMTNACNTPDINIGSFHQGGMSSRSESVNFSEKQHFLERQIQEKRLPLQMLNLGNVNSYNNIYK